MKIRSSFGAVLPCDDRTDKSAGSNLSHEELRVYDLGYRAADAVRAST
jgi:hypothetical protein